MIDETGNVISPAEWSDDTAAAISSLEVTSQQAGKDAPTVFNHKVKTWDKTRALEQIGKCLGMGKEDGPAMAVQIIIAKEDAAGF